MPTAVGETKRSSFEIVPTNEKSWNLLSLVTSKDARLETNIRVIMEMLPTPKEKYYGLQPFFEFGKGKDLINLKNHPNVFVYRGKFLDLPLVLPISKREDMGRVRNEVTPWLSPEKVSENGWDLVLDKEHSEDKSPWINWMEKRNSDRSLLKMRYWIEPSHWDGETPQGWYGRFEYTNRDSKNERTEKFKAKVGISIGREKGLVEVNSHHMEFSIWSIHPEEESVTFNYEGYGKELKVSYGPKFDFKRVKFKQATLDKMVKEGEFPNKDDVSFEELMAAGVFPNMRHRLRRINPDVTISNILKVYREGSLEDLSDFRQIEFTEF